MDGGASSKVKYEQKKVKNSRIKNNIKDRTKKN